MVWRFVSISLALTGVVAGVLLASGVVAVAQPAGGRLVTVYDRGVQRVFVSQGKTIGAALKEQGFELDPHDLVEPSASEEMVAADYRVNIYRARAVTVQDGPTRTKIMTPYQSAERIVKSANITLYAEDKLALTRSNDVINDDIGLILRISRAREFTLDLYGKVQVARTHEDTVGAMLKQKNIEIGLDDRVSMPLSSPIDQGAQIRVWREGKQTITEESPISFATEFVYDADRPVGYRAVHSEGAVGVRSITYEIEISEGKEVSRKQIAQLVTAQPKKQQLAIGIKGLEYGLTRSKGALHFKDSAGVVHRETYYDLPMNVVMGVCGQGGAYKVRFDGMKIDSEGYIIVAANYAKYPKCSVVETSAGPGRVYDTGGFVIRHPDGFDLATDWSKPDGI